MSVALEQIRTNFDYHFLKWKMAMNGLSTIQARVPMNILTSKYRIRTVDNDEDFQKVLRLRYEVFIKEGLAEERTIRLDLDPLDFLCDHLVIEDVATQEIVGTYRLICSEFSNRFYSEGEFRLDEFLRLPGIKLELGRACISKDHRRGIVISLLWQGIAEYARRVNASYLFGCASLWTTDVAEAADVLVWFRQNEYLLETIRVVPQKAYRLDQFQRTMLERLGGMNVEVKIPSLIRTYLKAGAKIVGEPAYDVDFKCFDYFTVLDRTAMTEQFERKYGLT